MCGLFFSPDRNFLIDKGAFAINDRPYNIDYAHADGKDNTHFGKSLFHENRCVGKSLYGIILDSNPYDDEVISGFNSKEKRPLELMIKCD